MNLERLDIELSDINGFKYIANLLSIPFSEGTFRRAFRGWLYGKSGQEPRHNTYCVIKTFIDESKNTLDNCYFDLKASIKAQTYAEIFNAYQFSNIKLEFLTPLVAKIDSISVPSSNFAVGKWVSIEPFLNGTYQKFNSNGCFEDRSHSLMSAFCHWTWEYSCYNYMVCDLQGVYYEDLQKYVLTDPAVHSKNKEFGMTDLRLGGMVFVALNHQCNFVCRKFSSLSMPQNITVSGSVSTIYDFLPPYQIPISMLNQQIAMSNQQIAMPNLQILRTVQLIATTVQQIATTVQQIATTVQPIAMTNQLIPITVQQIPMTVQQISMAFQQVAMKFQLIASAVRQIAMTVQQSAMANQQITVTFQQIAMTVQQIAITFQQIEITDQQIAKTVQLIPMTNQQIAITVEQITITVHQIAKTNYQIAMTNQQIAMTN